MSSILEALRELEGSKPPASRSRVAWAGGTEERPAVRRAAEVLGIVAFGLGLGGTVFALALWLGAPGEPEPRPSGTATAPVPAPAAAVATLGPAAPAPSMPAWLTRMGPPRGRVDGDPDARSDGARAAEPMATGTGLTLVGVVYNESRGQRVATLRIDGRPVVLREGETAHGIEVQLITPEGAYVRRGAEVLMLEQPR